MNQIREDLRIKAELPDLLGMTLVSYRQRLHILQEELEACSQVSVRTISRIESGTVQQPTAITLLSPCIGLCLSDMLSLDLMERGNWRPIPSVEAQLFDHIWRDFHGCSIEEVNAPLVNLNQKPLTNATQNIATENASLLEHRTLAVRCF